MKNKRIYDLVVASLVLAMILVLTFTPIGYIPTPLLSITIVHIPVLLGSYLYGKKGGLLFGLAFGLSSMINAMTRGVADQAFIYPWVSILPRLVFGFSAGFIFDIIKKKTLQKQLFLIPIGTFIATFVFHTWVVFVPYVLTYAYFFQGITLNADLWIFAAGAFATSGALEAAVAAIVVPLIIYAIEKDFREIKKKKIDLTIGEDTDDLGYGNITKGKM